MPRRTRLAPLAIMFWLCSPTAHAAACADVDGWNAGRHGQRADSACTADAYAEAFRLGEALADLHARHAALETRIAAEPDDAGALRRQQRQIGVDIEAINGVATVRGWPTQLRNGETTP